MKITKYIHSCLLVEDQGSKILFDPGSYSFIEGLINANDFRDLNAIFITHAHGDHYDIPALKIILQNNSQCKIYTNSDMGKILTENEISFELFEEGNKEISSFKVKAFSAAHQPIFDRVMPINTAFLVNEKFLHPGDSYAQQALEQHPEILALAVAGPWMNMNEGFEFTQKCNAKAVLPIHDGHIKDFFTSNMYKLWQEELAKQGIKFVNLQKPGDSVVLD